MTQIIVLDKLVAFLQLKQKKYFEQFTQDEKESVKHQQEYQDWEDYIARLDEQVDKGHCFGLAVVHAVKGHGELLDWWEQVLIDIATWDEREESLDQIKSLNMLPKQMGSMTGSDIFTYAINAIVSSHVKGEMNLILPELKQNNLLQTDSHTLQIPASIEHPTTKPAMESKRSFLEVGDKTIKQRKVMAGNLTKEQLMEDLNEVFLKDLIILVHNSDHSIRVGYDEYWMVYNSEYDHTKKVINQNTQKESIYRTYINRAECIDEIFRIQQKAIAIEVASFEEKAVIEFPAFDRRLRDEPISLISGEGLDRMIAYMPGEFEKIIKRISPQEKAQYVQVLTAYILKTQDGPQNENQYNGLHVLARNSETTLLELFKCINNSKESVELLSAVTKALPEKAVQGYTALHLMAYCAPNALLHLFQLTHHPRGGRALQVAIATTLTQQTQSGHTPLHLMLMSHSAKELLAALLDQINGSSEGIKFRTAFITALKKRDVSGSSSLDLIEKQAPEYLSKVKQIMNINDENNSASVSKAGHFKRHSTQQTVIHTQRRPGRPNNR